MRKKIVIISLDSDVDKLSLDELFSSIKRYHCEWVSPLKKRDVVYKLFMELGFLYFLTPVVLLIVYVTYEQCFDYKAFIINAVSCILIAIEFVFGFLKSPYYSDIKEDSLAKYQR